MKKPIINPAGIKIQLCYTLLSLLIAFSPANAQLYTLEWQKAFDWNSQMSTGDQAYDIQTTADNGYVLAGRTNLDPLWDAKGRVLKLDHAGAVVWDKLFGDSTATCYLNSIRQTQDGGFIALGSLTATNGATGMASGWHGSYDLLVVKLDALGNMLWRRALGGSGNEEPGAIRQTADGGYIIAASTSSNDGDVPDHHHFNSNDPWSDIWLVRLDASGNMVWQKTYGGSSEDNAAALEILPDGSFIVCGNTSSDDGDISGNHSIATDGLVMKISANGILLWQRCFGSPGEERFFDIKPATDGGFIAVGYNSSNGGSVSGFHGGFYDAWAVKMTAAGNPEWQRSIGGSGQEMAGSVKLLSNGGYVVAGTGDSPDGDVPAVSGQRDVWACYLSDNGGISGAQAFGGDNNDGYYSGWSAMFLGVSIVATQGQGLAIAACTQSTGIPGFTDNGDFYVVKLQRKGGCDTTIVVSDTIICNTDPFLVTLHSALVGGDSYRWVNAVPGPSITVVQPGTYFCNAWAGCSFHVDTIHVLLPAALPPDLGLRDMTACAGSDFIIGNKNSVNGIRYEWNTGEQQSFIRPGKPGVFTLTATNGCESMEDSAQVALITCEQCLFIPNAFSPNADGLNDFYSVRNLCNITHFQMQLYNRWGALVFQSNNIADKWDGTYHNGPADTGVYFYQISFSSDDDGMQYRKGDITLIR